MKILGLRLADNPVKKGIDATDKNKRTYQIKSRIVDTLEENTSFDFITIESSFDYLICVFFSPELEPLSIIRIPYEVVRELGVQNAKGFRFDGISEQQMMDSLKR